MKNSLIMLIRNYALILVLAPLSSTVIQSNNEEIVFVLGHYHYDLAIASSQGIIVITDGVDTFVDYTTPQWSPDGNQIAYTDHSNIYTMKADGSDLVQLTDYEPGSGQRILNISWSPDGGSIAATMFSGDQSYSGCWIRLIDLATLREHNLTTTSYLDGISGISWSPDSKQIVFTSNRDGDIPDATGLYLLDLETGSISALTDISTFRRDDRYPSWSPDGTQIAFVSESPDDGRWAIYLIDVDGSNLRRLTNQSNAADIIVGFAGTMDWSPTGDRLVFTACPGLYPEGCDLFTIRVDGTELTQITHDNRNAAFDPDWSRVTQTETEITPSRSLRSPYSACPRAGSCAAVG